MKQIENNLILYCALISSNALHSVPMLHVNKTTVLLDGLKCKLLIEMVLTCYSGRKFPHLFGLGLHPSIYQLTRCHVHSQLTRDVHCSVHNHRLAEDDTQTQTDKYTT